MQLRIEPLPDDLQAAQVWRFTCGGERTHDFADTKAVLIAPLNEKRMRQRLLILRGSTMKARTDVCKHNAKAIRERLVTLGLVTEADGGPRELLAPIVLTSPGLACNVLY